MAIQFARVEYVSRSSGKNACCKSAYNGRMRIEDGRANVTYTFERMGDNVYHEVLLPPYVHERFKEAKVLANEVERCERRKNSQLYREYVLALPDDKEINLKDRRELVHLFIQKKGFIGEGLGVQVDIHEPHDGEKNWHAHLLVTTRRFREDGEGLGEKARDLNPEVRGGRESPYVERDSVSDGLLWKEIQNTYFVEKGLRLRVDEISQSPGVHLGSVRMRGLMDKAAQFYEELRAPSGRESLKSGEDVIDLVTRHKAVFGIEDLERAVRDVGGLETQQWLIGEAYQCERLMPLKRSDGSDLGKWTTREVRAEEERALRLADHIHAQKVKGGSQRREGASVKCLVEEGRLSAHQGEALAYLVGERRRTHPSLRILQGRAGSGKSHVLGWVRESAERGQKVIGLAPTHKAASELKRQGYEEATTLKGFLFQHKNGKAEVPQGSLFVVDEAGMVGTQTMLELLKVVRGSRAELILCGDDRQLSSVERGGLFKVFSERYGCASLYEVRRQKSLWGREVSEAFSKGDVMRGELIF